MKWSLSEMIILNILKVSYVSEDGQCPPLVYWLHKLHKNSAKARFIIEFQTCSRKQLSKYITSAIKLIFNQKGSYNK